MIKQSQYWDYGFYGRTQKVPFRCRICACNVITEWHEIGNCMLKSHDYIPVNWGVAHAECWDRYLKEYPPHERPVQDTWYPR